MEREKEREREREREVERKRGREKKRERAPLKHSSRNQGVSEREETRLRGVAEEKSRAETNISPPLIRQEGYQHYTTISFQTVFIFHTQDRCTN